MCDFARERVLGFKLEWPQHHQQQQHQQQQHEKMIVVDRPFVCLPLSAGRAFLSIVREEPNLESRRLAALTTSFRTEAMRLLSYAAHLGAFSPARWRAGLREPVECALGHTSISQTLHQRSDPLGSDVFDFDALSAMFEPAFINTVMTQYDSSRLVVVVLWL